MVVRARVLLLVEGEERSVGNGHRGCAAKARIGYHFRAHFLSLGGLKLGKKMKISKM
jgi:hypothetical protein